MVAAAPLLARVLRRGSVLLARAACLLDPELVPSPPTVPSPRAAPPPPPVWLGPEAKALLAQFDGALSVKEAPPAPPLEGSTEWRRAQAERAERGAR